MKTFLFFAITSVITMASGALPGLPAKLTISALVLLGGLRELTRRAPVGYQDEKGFHVIRPSRSATKGRAQLRLWPTRKKLVIGWLFLDSRRPAKA